MQCIILAGGSGTRLWPLSREQYPKQFLPVGGDRSLFQRTWLRARSLVDSGDIWVVTNEAHRYLIRDQVEALGDRCDDRHLLAEVLGRNTLPAIAWAMAAIREAGGEAVAAVFPSDHLLAETALEAIRGAEPLAAERLVTFGIAPDSPHTGYGYIRPGAPLPGGFAVDAFVEKPDRATAEQYLRDGYLWNSGMFLLSTGVFFEELALRQPEVAAGLHDLPPEYGAMPSVSIDYGLLEASDRVAVVPLHAAWSDLGDFAALAGAEPVVDPDGNAGDALYLDAHNNYVRTEGKRVGLIGVDDLVVVDTDDALLVAAKPETGRVRELVAALKAAGDPVVVHHRQEHRPWGSYKVLEENGAYKIKRVTVRPERRLSLQLHHHRSEHWIVVSGTAEVELDGEVRLLAQGESTFVKTGQRHRLGNPGRIPLEVIEVQIGEYLEEDDIVRFQDEFGRS
jgi:mannose-1-phosphate guanylyltransferase/mannose-6-phosphate isomerase